MAEQMSDEKLAAELGVTIEEVRAASRELILAHKKEGQSSAGLRMGKPLDFNRRGEIVEDECDGK